jgi:hypothetical protein
VAKGLKLGDPGLVTLLVPGSRSGPIKTLPASTYDWPVPPKSVSSGELLQYILLPLVLNILPSAPKPKLLPLLEVGAFNLSKKTSPTNRETPLTKRSFN